MRHLFIRLLLGWVAILALAMANGGLREAVLVPLLGRTIGLVLSGVLLGTCVLAVACVLVRRHPGITVRQSLGGGVLWLALTLAFEFGFGRFVQHKSWSELLGAYTFEDGNIWSLVLLVTLVAPYLARRACLARAGQSPASAARPACGR